MSTNLNQISNSKNKPAPKFVPLMDPFEVHHGYVNFCSTPESSNCGIVKKKFSGYSNPNIQQPN